jgi:hypothetical protein
MDLSQLVSLIFLLDSHDILFNLHVQHQKRLKGDRGLYVCKDLEGGDHDRSKALSQY